MFRYANGYNLEKTMSKIREGNKGHRGMEENAGRCMYLTSDGNKCVIGCFIPDGHRAQKILDSVSALLELEEYSDLVELMPLEGNLALEAFQRFHDQYIDDSLHSSIQQWLIENVQE